MDKVEAAELLEMMRQDLKDKFLEYNHKLRTVGERTNLQEYERVLKLREALAEGANCLRNIEQWRKG